RGRATAASWSASVPVPACARRAWPSEPPKRTRGTVVSGTAPHRAMLSVAALPAALIRPELLHQLVVDAEHQEYGRPLTHEQAAGLLPHRLHRRGCGDGSQRRPQEGIRRQLRRLLLDAARNGPFRVLRLARPGHARVQVLHERLLLVR